MPIQIERAALAPFVRRLGEPRRFLQVVAGPRQVGKTTLVRQALAALAGDRQGRAIAQHSASADNPGLRGSSSYPAAAQPSVPSGNQTTFE